MTSPCIIAAAGTPLTPDERLHRGALAIQLDRLRVAGISGVLVAGTFGVMQMLSDATYHELVEHAVELRWPGSELMIGVSDLSLTRTRERIAFANRFRVSGVVVLPPFFMTFSQAELIAYYRALADASSAPLYIYHLPQRTHVELEIETILVLAAHPNIHGIKWSGSIDQGLGLIKQCARREIDFRVVIAHPESLGPLVASGVTHHLDGIYALAPQWAMRVALAPNGADAEQAQADLVQLRAVMRRHGGLSALSVLMNASGVPGNFAPAPFRALTESQGRTILAEPVVRRFLAVEEAASTNPGRSPARAALVTDPDSSRKSRILDESQYSKAVSAG